MIVMTDPVPDANVVLNAARGESIGRCASAAWDVHIPIDVGLHLAVDLFIARRHGQKGMGKGRCAIG
jgi:hypothetical protein